MTRHQVMVKYSDEWSQEEIETLIEQGVSGLRIEDVSTPIGRGGGGELFTFWAEPVESNDEDSLSVVSEAVEPLREHYAFDDVAVGVED